MYTRLHMERPKGAARDLFRRYIAANLLILLLPALVSALFYAYSARTVRSDVDELALNQLQASMAAIDRQLLDIRKVAAQFAIDYEVNMYLNNPGPFSAVETYNLKRVSEKLSSFVLGNDLLSHCFLYFAIPGLVAYENGYSDLAGFYGPVFDAGRLDSAVFFRQAMEGEAEETIFPGMETHFSGLKSTSILVSRPFGYGQYNRGALISVIEERNIQALLLQLPDRYGGWVAIYDSSGKLVTSTDPRAPRFDPALPKDQVGTAQTLRMGKDSWRLYETRSALTGWKYAAALDSRSVLSEATTIRDAALLILGSGFLGACIISFWFAYSHSKPLGKVLSMLLGDGARQGEDANAGIYERAEKAIAGLSDSRDRLEVELKEAERMARAEFLKRLLEGLYPDRSSFTREAGRLGIGFGNERWAVLVCKQTDSRFGPLPQDPREAGLELSLLHCATDSGEHAYIVNAGTDEREEAARISGYLRSLTPAESRSSLLFGCGDPYDDPFLLPLSCAQARTALNRHESENRAGVRFYADLPAPEGGFVYPFDLEESLVRAVRSSNNELFTSIFTALVTSNTRDRVLTMRETRDFSAALRTTAARMLPEYPEQAAELRKQLYGATDTFAGNPDDPGSIAPVFEAMMRIGEAKRKSHAARLASKARDFIMTTFADPGLGLAMVAREMGVSENYLSSLYKEQRGECVSETIENVRIETARRLLTGSELSIDEIAARIGYQVPSFRRAFKRVTGMAPSGYRNDAENQKDSGA